MRIESILEKLEVPFLVWWNAVLQGEFCVQSGNKELIIQYDSDAKTLMYSGISGSDLAGGGLDPKKDIAYYKKYLADRSPYYLFPTIDIFLQAIGRAPGSPTHNDFTNIYSTAIKIKEDFRMKDIINEESKLYRQAKFKQFLNENINKGNL